MLSNRYRREECIKIEDYVPIIEDNINILNKHSKAILETEVFKNKSKNII